MNTIECAIMNCNNLKYIFFYFLEHLFKFVLNFSGVFSCEETIDGIFKKQETSEMDGHTNVSV